MKKRNVSQRRPVVNPPVRTGKSNWTLLQGVIDALAPWLCSDLLDSLRSIIRSRDEKQYLSLQGEWGLQSKRLLPMSPGAQCATLLAVSVVRKYDDGTTIEDHVQAALKAVRDTDDGCGVYSRHRNHRRDLPTSATLDRARVICGRILGVMPDDISSHIDCRHGPGSSTSCSFRDSSSYFKYADWPYRVATRAKPHLRCLIESDQRWISYLEESYRKRFDIPAWAILNWDVFYDTIMVSEDFNKITTVPKDSTKVRPIAVEPTGNILLQLGVDGFIRRRLKRWGCNLDDQTLNQRLAYRGSVMSGPLTPVTIDLANASDTVSLGFVKDLIPDEWYHYLIEIRSPKGIFPDGSQIRYRKISSMGNGYTFALESLCFFCIAFAITEKYLGGPPRGHLAVFGDDIIVPEACGIPITRFLRAYGFTVNTEKSFLSGSVKESCGSDWVNGYNVRPVYLKSPISFESDIYSIRNRLRRWFVTRLGEYPESLDNLFLGWLGHPPMYVGPISDDEFDTYWHDDKPTPGMYRNGAYRFHSLSAYYKERKIWPPEFRLRTLMAPLRSMPKSGWSLALTTSSGSVFTVPDKGVVRYRRTRRTTADWQSSYSPCMTSRGENLDPACADQKD